MGEFETLKGFPGVAAPRYPNNGSNKRDISLNSGTSLKTLLHTAKGEVRTQGGPTRIQNDRTLLLYNVTVISLPKRRSTIFSVDKIRKPSGVLLILHILLAKYCPGETRTYKP